jgi:hypothetical protein
VTTGVAVRTNQPVGSHEDHLGVVDGLLGENGLLGEMGVDRRDTGGTLTFAGLDPLRPTVLKVGAASAAIAAGPEHQIQRPNLVTRMTPFGEFTRLGSQLNMSQTPESWADPILVPMGSSRPE